MKYTLVIASIVVGRYDTDGSSYPAAYRGGNTAISTGSNVGFRVVLYIS